MNKFWIYWMAALGLTSCKSMDFSDMRVFDRGVKEQTRYGKDATQYQCANGQSFGLKLLNQGEEAWVILPDRAIALQSTDKSHKHYHYGTMDLILNTENTTLDDSQSLHYQACKAVLPTTK